MGHCLVSLSRLHRSRPYALTPPSAAARPRAADEQGTTVFYDGEDDICIICADRFKGEDRVCRARCRPIFHTACLEQLMMNATRLNVQIAAVPARSSQSGITWTPR